MLTKINLKLLAKGEVYVPPKSKKELEAEAGVKPRSTTEELH
jgi:hypothetical protein